MQEELIFNLLSPTSVYLEQTRILNKIKQTNNNKEGKHRFLNLYNSSCLLSREEWGLQVLRLIVWVVFLSMTLSKLNVKDFVGPC